MLHLNANDLQIKKVGLAVGLNTKFVLIEKTKIVRLAVGLNAKFVLIEESNTFQNKDKEEMFDIRKGIVNCNSNLLVYLIECKLSFK